MASVIITKGELSDPRNPLDTMADKTKFRDGMKHFGLTFAAEYSMIDPTDDDARADALLKTFLGVIGSEETSDTGYWAYRIKETNGRARQIYNPRLKDETRGNGEKFVLLFDRRNGNREFRIVGRPDKRNKMHVSLTVQDDVSTYLQVTNEMHKTLSTTAEEVNFLLANSLISRCK